jgi:hypothetical protein
MTANEPFGEFSLTPEELVLLVLCLRRALHLHETGVISSEAVFEHMELVTDAMDPQTAKFRCCSWQHIGIRLAGCHGVFRGS